MFKFNNLKNFYHVYFFTLLLFVFLISFTIVGISYGQTHIMETESETSITSYIDALFKAPILISQALVVGVSFVHSFLFIRMIKKELIFFNNNKNYYNFFLSFLFDNKLFLIIIIVCGAIILNMSAILIVFQSYVLSFDLSLDLSSTFIILLSSSVGNIFIVKLTISAFIIALGILYYYIGKRLKNQNLMMMGENKSNQEEQNYNTKQNLKNQKISLTFCITILVLCSINIFSNSIQSHNAAVDFFPNLAISVDWLHFMMVSIWVGGLFYISLTLSKKLFIKKNSLSDYHHHQKQSSINYPNDSTNLQFFLSTILRFSIIAVVSLSIIFITGLYMAALHLQQPSSLVDSMYGNILILKLIIVFSMAGFGVYHHFKIPVLTNQKSENTKLNQLQNLERFNKTLKIEYLLGISIIFISSFLTVTSPPQHEMHNMDMLPIMPPLTEDSDIQKMTDTYNQLNFPFNQAFSIMAIIISILIVILMVLFVKKSWKKLKLYNQ